MKEWFDAVIWNNPETDMWLVFFVLILSIFYVLIGDFLFAIISRKEEKGSPIEEAVGLAGFLFAWPFVISLIPIFTLYENFKTWALNLLEKKAKI